MCILIMLLCVTSYHYVRSSTRSTFAVIESSDSTTSNRCLQNALTPVSCADLSVLDILLPHPDDCHLYYHCTQHNLPPVCRECPYQQHFNPIELFCDLPSEAGCELATGVVPIASDELTTIENENYSLKTSNEIIKSSTKSEVLNTSISEKWERYNYTKEFVDLTAANEIFSYETLSPLNVLGRDNRNIDVTNDAEADNDEELQLVLGIINIEKTAEKTTSTPMPLNYDKLRDKLAHWYYKSLPLNERMFDTNGPKSDEPQNETSTNLTSDISKLYEILFQNAAIGDINIENTNLTLEQGKIKPSTNILTMGDFENTNLTLEQGKITPSPNISTMGDRVNKPTRTAFLYDLVTPKMVSSTLKNETENFTGHKSTTDETTKLHLTTDTFKRYPYLHLNSSNKRSAIENIFNKFVEDEKPLADVASADDIPSRHSSTIDPFYWLTFHFANSTRDVNFYEWFGSQFVTKSVKSSFKHDTHAYTVPDLTLANLATDNPIDGYVFYNINSSRINFHEWFRSRFVTKLASSLFKIRRTTPITSQMTTVRTTLAVKTTNNLYDNDLLNYDSVDVGEARFERKYAIKPVRNTSSTNIMKNLEQMLVKLPMVNPMDSFDDSLTTEYVILSDEGEEITSTINDGIFSTKKDDKSFLTKVGTWRKGIRDIRDKAISKIREYKTKLMTWIGIMK